jgi:hypothetical protein
VHIPVYEAVDALCITPGAYSQLVKRCRSEAISMHTGLWSKVFSRVSVGEINKKTRRIMRRVLLMKTITCQLQP